MSSCASATQWSLALGLVAKEPPGRARALCIFRLPGPLLGQKFRRQQQKRQRESTESTEKREGWGEESARGGEPGDAVAQPRS